MAYILQQRRDTLANWNSVNPVLADAEIGFILDKDENGKQKSSLYKIGDGKTAWKDLPLFGWGGNVYQNFIGSDLSTSLASREATLNKINEITQNAISLLNDELVNGTVDVEGIINKLSKDQLVPYLSPVIGEVFGEITFEEETNLDDIEEQLRNQLVSRWILLQEFKKVWDDIDNLEKQQATTSQQVKTLEEFAETFGSSYTNFVNEVNPIISDHTSLLEEHSTTIEEHTKFINGWDEEVEDAEPIHHPGVDEKIQDLSNKFNVLEESEFRDIKDFSQFKEGTLFFTYKEEN